MARRSLAATMPAKLWMLTAGLVLLSLAWGVLGGWTVSQHASAANDVVHVDNRSPWPRSRCTSPSPMPT